jgi:hypothetical protein
MSTRRQARRPGKQQRQAAQGFRDRQNYYWVAGACPLCKVPMLYLMTTCDMRNKLPVNCLNGHQVDSLSGFASKPSRITMRAHIKSQRMPINTQQVIKEVTAWLMPQKKEVS